jgi:hypothetical protein
MPSGIDAAEATGAIVFQAGTRLEGDTLVAPGGRVLAVTAMGANIRPHATRRIGAECDRFRRRLLPARHRLARTGTLLAERGAQEGPPNRSGGPFLRSRQLIRR